MIVSKDPEIKLFGTKIALPEIGKIAVSLVFGDDSSGEFIPVASHGDSNSTSSDPDCESAVKMRSYKKTSKAEEEESDPEKDHLLGREISKTEPQEKTSPPTSEESTNPNTPPDEENPAASLSNKDEDNQKPLKKPDKILPCPRCNSNDTKFCYYNNYNVNQPRHFCKNCQRYWTAGGTMRNVPVGAGRRKNKTSIPNYRHPNGTILSFGSDSPIFEYMEPNRIRNGFCRGGENGNPSSSSGSSINSMGDGGRNRNGFQEMYPWPYNWSCSSSVPVPAPGFVVPFFPVPYWNIPCLSPTLGKHSREGEVINRREKTEGTVLVPKTLRIDDPEEAARSSIWATLGIKNETVTRNGLFKAFQPKSEEKDCGKTNSPLLQANPAALSRSFQFQESA